jgi:hypothetical protein
MILLCKLKALRMLLEKVNIFVILGPISSFPGLKARSRECMIRTFSHATDHEYAFQI